MYLDGLLTALINGALFAALALFRRLVHKEGLDAFLLHADRQGLRLLFSGMLLGVAAFASYVAMMLLSGAGQITLTADRWKDTLIILGGWGLGFLGVALFEESFYRGYLLQKLLPRLPFWLALLLPAALFGAWHLLSYPDSPALWLGILDAVWIGLALSFLILATRSLLPAIGFHWIWNLSQTFVFSAYHYQTPALVNLKIDQTSWTGLPAAPEAGLAGLAIAVLLLGGSALYWRRTARQALSAR